MKTLDYQQAFGAWDKTTEAMEKAIGLWLKLYYDSQPTPEADPCQRIAYTVVQKLVRAVFSEYSVSCDEGFWGRLLQKLDDQKQAAVQMALIGGECYIKPCLEGDSFGFTLIPRHNVLVFGRDAAGELTDVGTAEKTVAGRYYYTLLERRTVDGQGYLTIRNRLYRSLNSETLGQPVALTEHPLYEGLAADYTYPAPVGSVGLVRVKTPMLNCVDGSADGVSVYAAATGLIRLIDRNEAQLSGEFERGESRIIASKDMLDEDARLSQTLFLGLDEDPETVGLHIFSPQLREASFLARKLEYLRNVESIIGLQRGMLSEVNAQERTATEISASSGVYNLTVMDFQRMWEQALRKAVALCLCLAQFHGMHPGKVPQITVDWGNGVLYDEEKTWQDYKDMAAQGLIAPEVALGWRFNMPAQTEAQREQIRKTYMGAATM